jgi:hypothetical protein
MDSLPVHIRTLGTASVFLVLVSAGTPAVPQGTATNPAVPQGSYMSLFQYIELESNAADRASGSPLVTLHLGGVIEAFGIGNTRLRERGQTQLYCMNSGLSADVLRRLINAELARTQGIQSRSDFEGYVRRMNVGGLALIALQKNFPCQKK